MKKRPTEKLMKEKLEKNIAYIHIYTQVQGANKNSGVDKIRTNNSNLRRKSRDIN